MKPQMILIALVVGLGSDPVLDYVSVTEMESGLFVQGRSLTH